MKKIVSPWWKIALPILSLLAVFGLPFGLFVVHPVQPGDPTIFVVPEGASFSSIARQLESQGIVSSSFNMKLLARLRRDTLRVQAGEYNFAAPSRPGRVLDRLVAGDMYRLRLTIPEGLTLQQIGQRLKHLGYQDHVGFLEAAQNEETIKQLGIEAGSLEGYLFPETYTFGPNLSSRHLIRFMVAELNRRLTPEIEEQAAELGLTRHELITLASIIQKEAGSEKEMPLISAVFHNRLRKGMRLQADPTVIYGLENFRGNLTRSHLRQPTPYNTYTNFGLPPGPIANPGSAALQAAANPAEVNYLYFVARGDGLHQFSRTLREHNQAVQRYLRNLRQRNTKPADQGTEPDELEASSTARPSGQEPQAVLAAHNSAAIIGD